jgi:hypothetical protein
MASAFPISIINRLEGERFIGSRFFPNFLLLLLMLPSVIVAVQELWRST